MPKTHHLLAVKSHLRSGRRVTAEAMAANMECSERTVRRCVEHLRDVEGWPVESGKLGYWLREPSVAETRISSHAEIAAVALALEALQVLGSTEIGMAVRKELLCVCRNSDDLGGMRWELLKGRIDWRPTSDESAEYFDIQGRLTLAILQSRPVRIEYRRLEEDHAFSVEVYPHRLLQRDGCWYLAATDLERGGQKVYALPRVSEVTPKAAPEGFMAPEFVDHYRHAFGIWTPYETNGPLHEVCVAITGYWARIALERRWHPSQTIEELEPDLVRVHFRLSELVEVKSWTLRFGGAAAVVAPEQLREMVREEVAQMAETYLTKKSNN